MSFIKIRSTEFNSNYKKHFILSLIFSLLLLIFLFKFSPDKKEITQIKENEPVILNIAEITPTRQQKIIPPKQIFPVPVNEVRDQIEEIEFESTEINFNEELKDPPPMYKPKTIEEKESKIHIVAEEMPELIGGTSSIQSKVHYTEIARRVGIEGQVVIKVIVDENGDVIDAEVVKKLFDDLDRISLEAARQLKFIPGRQRGKPVKVQVHIPINFKLK